MERTTPLSFWDKNITPRTKEYKDFIREMENTPSEIFFKDGEREFTKKEKKFLEIYRFKNQIKRISPEEFYARQDYPKITAEQLDNYLSKAKAYGHNDYYLEKMTNLIYDEPPKFMAFSDAEKNKMLERINNNNELIAGFNYTSNELNINLKEFHTISDFLEKHPNMGISFFQQKEEINTRTKEANITNLSLSNQILLIEDTKEDIKLKESDYARVNTTILQKVFNTNELNSILLEKGSDEMRKHILNGQEIGANVLLNAITSRIEKNEVERTNAQQIIENYHLDSNAKFLKNILDTAPPKEKELLESHFNAKSEDFTNWFNGGKEETHWLNDFNQKYNSADETTQKAFNNLIAVLDEKGLNDAQNIEHSLRKINDYEQAINFFIQKQPNQEVKQPQKLNNMDNTNEKNNQLDYLKNQLKYTGFGSDDALLDNLKTRIANDENGKFQLSTKSDKANFGNKVEFNLKFNKTDDKIFFNGFEAKLTTTKGQEKSHNFSANSQTAKEAINLLEGRAVLIDFKPKNSDETKKGFIKFDFKEPKNEYGKYQTKIFLKEKGIDVRNILEKQGIKFNNENERSNAIKHLEKGNITELKFEHDNKEIQGKAILNPQYKFLQLYDSNMKRLNSNKSVQSIEERKEKNMGKQQHYSRTP
ncbi:Uncharacterised protein [Candidatus Ornithobacterium hominis]|uniref:DUF3945 domain-containing protein n=2 Tax=Candidatus Ornithobacterium hominis TaxID=2497989 RepID=A0A383U3R1_9FLAO|nr:Uncharacterised protein [Candidatus Ornithobacterium hominis]